MRLGILILSLGYICPILLADEMVFPVYSEDQAGLIVTKDYAQHHKANFAESFGVDADSIDFWTPSTKEIDQAQQTLRKAIYSGQANPRSVFPKPINGDDSADELQREQGEIEEIGTNFDRYARQYVGVISKGKKLIFCNFIDPQYSDKKYDDLANNYIFFPKGFVKELHVLQAYFDPEINRCFNIGIIGPWTTPPGMFVKIGDTNFLGYIVPKAYAEQSLGYLGGEKR